MKEISGFAAILQAPETSSKLSCRLCTAEVRGSNPLGSTLKTSDLQIKDEPELGILKGSWAFVQLPYSDPGKYPPGT
jgi:hypothetical protein